ncbi:MAG: S-layer homology domain-containing protein, partial [Nitriliruptorales bacterium]
GGDSTQADVDYTGFILLALDSLSGYGLPANFVAASRGGWVMTGAGTTAAIPSQTSVTTPVAGTVSITPKKSTTTTLGSGQTLLNVEVDIDAPDATPEEPLVLDFELDSSLLEDVDLGRLVVYRNGEAVPACADPVHGQAAEVLAAADVLEGVSARSFDPAGTVSRDQLASLLVGVYEYLGDRIDVTDADPFSDDDASVHAGAIAQAAAAGFVSGVGADRFDPDGVVTREQFATFVANVLGKLVDDNLADPPGPVARSPRRSGLSVRSPAWLIHGMSGIARSDASPDARSSTVFARRGRRSRAARSRPAGFPQARARRSSLVLVVVASSRSTPVDRGGVPLTGRGGGW